jgi:hypothetical protein
MELRFTFDSSEDMREWESWGTVEGLTAAVGQIDALLAAGPNR